jgi:hypothetical protein
VPLALVAAVSLICPNLDNSIARTWQLDRLMRERHRGPEPDRGVRNAWRVGPADVTQPDVVLSPDHPSPKPDSCRNLRRRGPVKGLPAGIAKRPLTGSRRCVPSRSGFGGGLAPSSDLIARRVVHPGHGIGIVCCLTQNCRVSIACATSWIATRDTAAPSSEPSPAGRLGRKVSCGRPHYY